jgi:hypothetical protein
MANASEFSARGKVIRQAAGRVVFAPSNTTYEMDLALAGDAYAGPVNVPVAATIRLKARKVYTVPAGGNFITPIQGETRIVQGRVRAVNDRELVLHCGTNVVVELPADEAAIEQSTGPIRVGGMVNAVCLPGAAFELIGTTAPAATA